MEALSVTPFAPRAIDRGLTGLLTGLVRQSAELFNPNAGAEAVTAATLPEVKAAKIAIRNRAHEVSQDIATKNLVNDELDQRIELWTKEANKPGRNFGYKKYRDGSLVPWLKSPYEGIWTQQSAPMSLREVEQNVQLLFREEESEEYSPPPWEPPPVENSSSDENGGQL